jgi:hypothetical protein
MDLTTGATTGTTTGRKQVCGYDLECRLANLTSVTVTEDVPGNCNVIYATRSYLLGSDSLLTWHRCRQSEDVTGIADITWLDWFGQYEPTKPSQHGRWYNVVICSPCPRLSKPYNPCTVREEGVPGAATGTVHDTGDNRSRSTSVRRILGAAAAASAPGCCGEVAAHCRTSGFPDLQTDGPALNESRKMAKIEGLSWVGGHVGYGACHGIEGGGHCADWSSIVVRIHFVKIRAI